MAERPIGDIDDPGPGDREGVDIELVAVVKVIVDHRRQEVMGHRDGVGIAGEMEVEVLHRDNLGVAAAGGAALDPKGWSEAGLADVRDGATPDPVEGLGETDGRQGLALAEGSWSHAGDYDELSLRLAGQAVE